MPRIFTRSACPERAPETAPLWTALELAHELSTRGLAAGALQGVDGALFLSISEETLDIVLPEESERTAIAAFRNTCRVAVLAAIGRAAAADASPSSAPLFGCSIADCGPSNSLFSSLEKLCEHMREAHQQPAQMQTLTFASELEANNWRLALEERSLCTFVKPRGDRTTRHDKVSTFVCSRSASTQSVERAAERAQAASDIRAGETTTSVADSKAAAADSKAAAADSKAVAADGQALASTRSGARRPNRIKDSKKLSFRCCAQLEMRIHNVTGRTTVNFISQHSHSISKRTDLRFQALAAQDLQFGRQLLEAKVPIAQVVRTLQGPLTSWRHRARFDELCTRLDFVSRQDVANLLHALHDVEDYRHANDSLSLDKLVREMQAEPGCPILFYKPAGVRDTSNLGWADDSLVLVFSTVWQREQFAKHSWKVIAVDGTFGVCDKELMLMSLVVVDDAGYSIPVGWVLAPSESKLAYTTLFAALAAHVPESVNAQITNLMSDDNKSGAPHRRSLCPSCALCFDVLQLCPQLSKSGHRA